MKIKYLIKLLLFGILPSLIAQNADVFSLIEEKVEINYYSNFLLYKNLHQHPELSFQEKETSKLIVLELNNLGFEVTENFGGYGVVGILKNGDGPVILLRTDLDALPIEEKTGLPYASKVLADLDGKKVSVMHACGHDMHMTSFIGTAKILANLKEYWHGTLFLLAQPAEERGGAKFVVEDGLFQKFPVPDMAFAYHVSPTIEAGKIAYIPGPAFAKVNTLEITVKGFGGHGARPHQGIDPIVLSSRIILAMQTIISREISALEPAVLTVGAINGGSKHNIIPDEVHMMLTLRSYSNEVAEHMISAINRTCVGIAQSAGLPKSKYPIVIEVDESLPPGINNPELTERIAQILKDKMGDKVFQDEPSMGAEDFYRYGNTEHNIPVSMLRLGTVSKEKIEQYKKEGRQLPSLHSPLFAPDPELTIKTGIKAMSYLMIEMFNNNLKGN